MKLGWFDSGNFDNVYCGKDGGSYIRIPLLRELNRRGVQVDFEGYDPGNYPYSERALQDLGILKEAYRYRDGIPFARHENVDLTRDIADYDMLFVEARSPEFSEYQRQEAIIEAAREEDVITLLFDRNNWAKEMPKELRTFCWLIRPYPKIPQGFKKTEYFPYWYDTQIPECNLEPEYDLVYVGNRWGREEQMMEFLDDCEDAGYSLLIAGNWVDREPWMVDTYDWVEWVGSTPHFSTIPLLSLGKATFHVGKPDYNELGFVTMRAAEAWMANRPCFYHDSVLNGNIDEDYFFEDPSDIDPSLGYEDAAKPVRSAESAAKQLLQFFI